MALCSPSELWLPLRLVGACFLARAPVGGRLPELGTAVFPPVLTGFFVLFVAATIVAGPFEDLVRLPSETDGVSGIDLRAGSVLPRPLPLPGILARSFCVGENKRVERVRRSFDLEQLEQIGNLAV